MHQPPRHPRLRAVARALITLACACVLAPPSAAALAAPRFGVSYYGGPVMHSAATYAVFWGGADSFPAGYEQGIDTFLTRVGADRGNRTTVYAVSAEYSDAQGAAASSVSFAGGIEDRDPYPTAACHTAASNCITLAQLQAELGTLIDARGLPSGLSQIYVVMTPPGTAVCTDATGSECSSGYFCSYHGVAATSGADAIYAVVPYARQCGVSENPNGLADGAIDSIAHEQLEAITDPYGNAWHDAARNEIADLCENVFGARLGGSPGHYYNQLIGAGRYYIQDAWSNRDGRCVARAESLPAAAARARPGITEALRGLRLTRGRIASESTRRRERARISFSASTRGSLTLMLERIGRRAASPCRFDSRPCADTKSISTLHVRAHRGRNQVALSRLLGRRRLHPGRYLLTLILRTPGGMRERSIRLRVV